MQKEIEVYTLPSCPRCKRVRAFLNEKGVRYVNFNVEEDIKAYNRMVKLTDQYNVPVIILNKDKIILGDDLVKIDEALFSNKAEDFDHAAYAKSCTDVAIPEENMSAEPEPVFEPDGDTLLMECDLAVLGFGAAGLSAAFYAGCKGLTTVVISDKNGGIIRQRHTLYDYPGILKISGLELVTNICEQAQRSGVKFIEEAVSSVIKGYDGRFFIETAGGAKFAAKAVIAAPGSRPSLSGAEGEREFIGRGVAFCPVDDVTEYKDKNVAVFGDGNIALETVAELAASAKEVHVITKGGWKADAVLLPVLKNRENIVFHHGFTIQSVTGKDFLDTVFIQKTDSRLFNGAKRLRVDALVLGAGFEPDTALFKGLAELNDAKEIVVNIDGKTSCDGLFAAGSATSVKAKGAAVSAGDGVKAALSAFAYLRT